ncbi:hypothetical protein [Streptomyces sp. ME19-01-6]|uniref:hypothetical protein n=1 Tax=Streptomyces sp. ME19-01-6 TaxID=3028686 RepID=UPI0029BCA133|nr:hypothetical protein [Streptomyces sp. ME19-01-6]MDX3230751.1 hypothetical protein [Streptomyces sp. ME19-01-6]
MFGAETTTRVNGRALGAAIVVALIFLTVACGSAAASSGAQASFATRQSHCASPGKVYSQKVLVTHKDKRLDWITLFLVCTQKRSVEIVDYKGRDYQDLDDFRANNEILSEDDKITLPRDFPSVDGSGKLELMTVSGHTGTSNSWLPWLVGGAVFVLSVVGGGIHWALARRRSVRASASDVDPQEPSA